MSTPAERPPRPLPCYDAPYQPGISDPQWPAATPPYLKRPEDRKRYRADQAGRPDAQDWIVAIRLDVAVKDRDALRELLKDLSDYARQEMLMPPGKSDLEIWNPAPASRRVTITIAFGHSLFLTPHGDDRFGLRNQKPKWLREMPPAEEMDAFEPAHDASDLMVIVASDAQQVNDRVLMAIKDGRWSQQPRKDERLIFRSAESGYQRLDYRDHLHVADGANNLSNLEGELDRLVFVKPEDFEPAWCLNGSYLLWKRLELNRPKFDAMSDDEKSAMIGRDVRTGQLWQGKGGGHIMKVQPRGKESAQPDMMGISDLDRRFLRRGYIYIGKGEQVAAGRLFFSYMRSLEAQGEWAVQMWQSNPDFPTPGFGRDPLFTSEVARGLAGGYYFCPSNRNGPRDFVGSGLFT